MRWALALFAFNAFAALWGASHGGDSMMAVLNGFVAGMTLIIAIVEACNA